MATEQPHEASQGDQQSLDTNNVSTAELANKTFRHFSEREDAYSYIPEQGFSLFLANRVKTIHCVRHAEGTHNEANRAHGDDTPVTYSTEGAWRYIDARLTNHGIQQCIEARQTLDGIVNNPQLVVVSPFTRTLQTAHIMFGGKGRPFIVHHLAKERSGRYTCDKMRPKAQIVADMAPIYAQTRDVIDFDTYGYPGDGNDDDEDATWQEEREPAEQVIARSVELLQWLASRPEQEIVLVSHSSFLKHLFRNFGEQTHENDRSKLHRLAGNAEIRSIALALHRGFYPPGKWDEGSDSFIPDDPTFRVGKWAPSVKTLQDLHVHLRTRDGPDGDGGTVLGTTDV